MDQIRYGWVDRQSPSLDTREVKSKIFLPHPLSPTSFTLWGFLRLSEPPYPNYTTPTQPQKSLNEFSRCSQMLPVKSS